MQSVQDATAAIERTKDTFELAKGVVDYVYPGWPHVQNNGILIGGIAHLARAFQLKIQELEVKLDTASNQLKAERTIVERIKYQQRQQYRHDYDHLPYDEDDRR